MLGRSWMRTIGLVTETDNDRLEEGVDETSHTSQSPAIFSCAVKMTIRKILDKTVVGTANFVDAQSRWSERRTVTR
jgi:hypothetical protein